MHPIEEQKAVAIWDPHLDARSDSRRKAVLSVQQAFLQAGKPIKSDNR